MSVDLRAIARALGGEVCHGQVSAPGPGHSPRDRSLSVRPSLDAPNGFIVFSHAGDPFDVCRDHVAGRLGTLSDLRAGDWPQQARPSPTSDADVQIRIARAVALWAEGRRPHGTIVERYLSSRSLKLLDGCACLRFHPRCPWRVDDQTIFVPAMLAAMRSVKTDAITAVHRTRLTTDGVKVDRRMLGVAAGAAIKLDADDSVTSGLAVGEGIETCLSGRQIGFRPIWALASAGAVASFPVLPGVGAITLLSENDAASESAIAEVALRWHQARREVLIIDPAVGDLNDAVRAA